MVLTKLTQEEISNIVLFSPAVEVFEWPSLGDPSIRQSISVAEIEKTLDLIYGVDRGPDCEAEKS